MNLRVISGRVVDRPLEALGKPLAAISDADRLAIIRCTARRISGDDDVSTWRVEFFAYGRRSVLAQETVDVIGPFTETGLASLDALLRGAGLTRWGGWRMSLLGDFMEGGCCEDFDDPLESL